MRPLTALLAATSIAVAAAACGGDDADVAPPDDSPSTPGEGDGDGPADPADETSEMAGEMAEALDELGVDPDDDIDAQVDELMDDLDEFVSGFGGDGGGIVTVDGITYTVEADVCIARVDDIVVDGPGVGSDGSDAWVSVSHSVTTRESMEGVLDDSMIDLLFPEGVDVNEETSVSVDVGRTGRMESGDGPRWSAASLTGAVQVDQIEYEVVDGGVRGAGEATDLSSDFGATVAPIEFEFACG